MLFKNNKKSDMMLKSENGGIMEKKKNKLIILLIVLLIAVVVIIVNLVSNKGGSISVSINEDQEQQIYRYMHENLNTSAELKNDIFTSDSMLQFAYSFMTLTNTYEEHIVFDENESVAKIERKYITEVVEYIFGKKLDVRSLTCEVVGNIIYVPIRIEKGDVRIYEYKSSTYDENADTYIAYVDCIEPTIQYLETGNYNYNDIISTLEIKYSQQEEKRTLLSFNVIVR